MWLTISLGERKSEATKLGREGHEAAIALAESVSPKEAWQEAFRPNRRKPYVISEFMLAAEYNGVPIVGRADEATFLRGTALRVLERKFMRKPTTYDSTGWTQLRLYSLLLELMGFEVKNLSLELEAWPIEYREYAMLGSEFLEDAGIKVRKAKRDYDPVKARKEIDWAIGFWREGRAPVPTRKEWKCKSCSYVEECLKS